MESGSPAAAISLHTFPLNPLDKKVFCLVFLVLPQTCFFLFPVRSVLLFLPQSLLKPPLTTFLSLSIRNPLWLVRNSKKRRREGAPRGGLFGCPASRILPSLFSLSLSFICCRSRFCSSFSI